MSFPLCAGFKGAGKLVVFARSKYCECADITAMFTPISQTSISKLVLQKRFNHIVHKLEIMNDRVDNVAASFRYSETRGILTPGVRCNHSSCYVGCVDSIRRVHATPIWKIRERLATLERALPLSHYELHANFTCWVVW